jgi:hypothetical protein
MFRVGFVGIPGTGKSYTARAFSSVFKYDGKYLITEVIAEYARSYLAKYGPLETIWEQYKILDKQLEKEERLSPRTELLITDSPLQLAFQYSLDLRRPNSAKDSMVLDDIFHKISSLNTPPRYDIIFHLPPVIEVVADGVRPAQHLDSEWRKEADVNIKYICKNLFPPKKWIEVTPLSIEDRVKFCSEELEKYIREQKESMARTMTPSPFMTPLITPTVAKKSRNIRDMVEFSAKIEINGKTAEEMEAEQKNTLPSE